jgi:methionyl-tRNA formyltransferase
LRIILIGQRAFALEVLKKLVYEKENVVAVISDNKPSPHVEDVLISESSKLGIPTHQISNWSILENQDFFASLRGDLCIMAFVEAYIPKKILDTPSIGTIQFHPSLCPLYRGPSAMSWAIANGEKFTGITVFWPNEKLDEGPIMLQKVCEIDEDENMGELYFKKIFPLGVNTLIEAVKLIKEGIIIKHSQHLNLGHYQRRFIEADAKVDWSKNYRECYNTIRAAYPKPGATTEFLKQTVTIVKASKSNSEIKAAPGEVINIDKNGVTVSAEG